MAGGQAERRKEKKHSIIQEVKAVNLNLKICLELCWVTSNFRLLGPYRRTVKSEFLGSDPSINIF